jgi:hypothetical protein
LKRETNKKVVLFIEYIMEVMATGLTQTSRRLPNIEFKRLSAVFYSHIKLEQFYKNNIILKNWFHTIIELKIGADIKTIKFAELKIFYKIYFNFVTKIE